MITHYFCVDTRSKQVERRPFTEYHLDPFMPEDPISLTRDRALEVVNDWNTRTGQSEHRDVYYYV